MAAHKANLAALLLTAAKRLAAQVALAPAFAADYPGGCWASGWTETDADGVFSMTASVDRPCSSMVLYVRAEGYETAIHTDPPTCTTDVQTFAFELDPLSPSP